ncbi:hypothetical protein Sste5344_003060 [Sporothrix stenoceras]
MACCYIAAYCVGQLVKASQFFDLDNGIRYNDEDGIETFIRDIDNDSEKAAIPKPPAADGSNFVVSIDGMTCSACTSAVEDTVGKINGLVRIVGVLQILYWGNIAFLPGAIRALLNAATLATAFYIQVQLVPWIHKDGWGWINWEKLMSGQGISGGGGVVNMNTLISLSIVLGLAVSLCDFIFGGASTTSSPNFTTVGLTLVVVSGRYLEASSRRSAFGFFMGLYKPLHKTNYSTLHLSRQTSNNMAAAAAKRGILIDGGMDIIKRLQRSRTVIFDKTGTLTEARLNVEDLVTTPTW